MFALFKSDAHLAVGEANPALRFGPRGLTIVTVSCVVAGLPLADATDGWSFVVAPFAASAITLMCVRRGPRIRLAIAAMCATFALMVLVAEVIIAMVYGVYGL